VVAGVGAEDRPDQRRQHRLLLFAGVAERLAQEVDGAALPGAAEHLADRVLQTLVRVRDDQLYAGETALDQAAEELAPERLRLALATVEADHLTPARLVHAVRDHQALADDAAAVADLLDLGVEPQIGVAALERSCPEGFDLLVEAGADPRHLAA
jgi:hypothetical protein